MACLYHKALELDGFVIHGGAVNALSSVLLLQVFILVSYHRLFKVSRFETGSCVNAVPDFAVFSITRSCV